MAIRKNTNPRMMDLQPEMQDILRRNGMQAHVVSDDTGYRLVVQGHDSPLLTYDLTERQMLALTDWGTNSANKKAYNVFTSIVGKDFYMPKNFVHARNANGRVAMGLHGYRIGIGEYGRVGRANEAGRIAIGRLRILLQVQGRTTYTVRTTDRCPAGLANGHHADGQPSA